MMPDPVHLLVSVPLKYSISQFMGYLMGNRNFWATEYYASTVGLNIATVQNIFENKKNRIK